jgi:hypothetical protein
VDVENERSHMRDNDQGYQRLVEVGGNLNDTNDSSSNVLSMTVKIRGVVRLNGITL